MAFHRTLRVVLLGLAALVEPACQGSHEPPSVVLIVIDTLRADHLSHYDYPRPTATALDDFRKRATVFTRCYAPSPWTGPSVASLLTGLHPARHRATARASTCSMALKGRRWTTPTSRR